MAYQTLMDSLDKIAKYLHAVAAEPFTFKEKSYAVATTYVSPSVFRDYKCPARCGACCRPFTMDWIPREERPGLGHIAPRSVECNGIHYRVYSDTQADRKGMLSCRYLVTANGRCGIHDQHTLSCDFPMITVKEVMGVYRIGGQLFGRLGQMRRPTDGGKGGKCTIHDTTAESRADVVRKFKRLANWCDYFRIPNRCQDIINWAEGPSFNHPIAFQPDAGLFGSRKETKDEDDVQQGHPEQAA